MSSSSAVIVECVPNFSEGRRRDVIDAIADAIRRTSGCQLLDVDAGHSTNRTVYTFVGPPGPVVEGALNAARAASVAIDMREHTGEHPRMGALDVCPFVPVAGVTMDDCVRCSREFGRRLGEELRVPVFLYEASAHGAALHRRTLPQIREGEYELLPSKLKQEEWRPDYGPGEFVPRWGATVTGARSPLVAYNVNLLATKQQAHRIALNLREQGRGPKAPGRLKAVKAIGWYLQETDLAQVSMNLTDYKTTPLHLAFEECCREASELSLPVVGSEVVGLLPLEAVLMAAEHYINKESLFVLQESQKVRLVVDRLRLSSVSEFKPEEKIIEYRVGSNKSGPLASGSVRSFVESLGSRTPAPGGGSASACVASMGAALGSMVGLLTYGNKKYENLDGKMRAAIGPLHAAMHSLLPLIDRDTLAFEAYMSALKLPHSTAEEKKRRSEVVLAGLQEAIAVPLELMRVASECWPHLLVLGLHGNITAISDLQVGVLCLCAGVRGAASNVFINLKLATDTAYVESVTLEVDRLIAECEENSSRVLQVVKDRLSAG